MEDYDSHVDALAHLSKFAWNRVRHLPTYQAIAVGEKLDRALCRIWKGHNLFLMRLDAELSTLSGA